MQRILISMLLTLTAVDAAELINGGFENRVDPLAGWRVEAERGAVEPVRIGGQWLKVTVTFNSDDCDRVNLCIGGYANPTGKCWIDNLQPQGFEIKNPSFEQSSGGRCAHWGHEGPGEWTHVSREHVSDGRQSLMMFDASCARQMIRLTQTVTVRPHTDYRCMFDFFMADDYMGALRASAIAAPPKKYRVLGGVTHVNGIEGANIDDYIADRSAAGPQHCRLKLDGGAATIMQRTAVPPGRHLEVGAIVKTVGLKGEVTLAVTDTDVLGESALTDTGGVWQHLRVPIVSRTEWIQVQLCGEGNGWALIDNVYLSHPVLRPAVQAVIWHGASSDFLLPATLSYGVRGRSSAVLQTGLAMLAKDLQPHNLDVTGSDEAMLRITTNDTSLPRGSEAYALDVSKQGVRVRAASERGAFFGLMTLLQLIAADPEGRTVMIGCSIEDWPELPWRALNRGAPGLTPEWMARRKANIAFHINEKDIDVFARHGIEAIPHENITHFPYNNPNVPEVMRDPNCAEGSGRTDELVLHGERPAELGGRNVLRTELTGVVVTSADGKATYEEGRDYRVIPGELKMSPRQPTSFLQDGKPFAIARSAGSRIADGGTVKATYEHVDHGDGELCLAELAPQIAVAELMAKKVTDYGLRYIGLHVSESPTCVGKGPRCRATGLTPSQLLGRYYQRLDRAIKQANPECRMICHADDFYEWQHAGRSGLADAIELLPKDAILSSWHYNPGDSVKFAYKSAALSAELGLDFFLVPFYDYHNIHVYAAAAKWARDKGMPCLGLSDWAYHLGPYSKLREPAPFIEEALCVAWRVPRKGEPGYVDPAAFEAMLPGTGVGTDD